jgi:hypothetical protein
MKNTITRAFGLLVALSIALHAAPAAALRGDGHEPVRPPCNTERVKQCQAEHATARDSAAAAAASAAARLGTLTRAHLALSESSSSEEEELGALTLSAALAENEKAFLSTAPAAEKEIFPGGPGWSELLAPPLRHSDWEPAGRALLLEKFSSLPQVLSARASALRARGEETRNEIAALSGEIQAWQAEASKQDEFTRQHAYQCERGCAERICPAIF